MKINRNNYELYFMDYLDGKLSDREILMLEDFLLINPDLRTELEGTEKISLSPESMVFEHKELLKKPDLTLPVNKENFQDFCIAGSEGDLSEQQLSSLHSYTQQNQGSAEQYALFHQLHLVPDKNIVFPGKGKLKKTIVLIPREFLYPALSVAAAVTFLLILYIRNGEIRDNIGSVSANLPETVISNPVVESLPDEAEKPGIKVTKPVIEKASVINIPAAKAKKQNTLIKTQSNPEKSFNPNKNREQIPQQRLNPSFQIKLPSIAGNQVNVPVIERGKITFAHEPGKVSEPEYLSLSEYARQQVTEKVFGEKQLENNRITGWQLADAGLNGINKLTGGEMKLGKTTDDNGNITAYSFNSRLLSFSTTAVK